MHDDDLRAYVEEICHQQTLVDLAVEQLNNALQARPTSHVACFAAAQAILTGAAQISKLLWTETLRRWSQERSAFALDRAASLREIVGVDDQSILKSRTVRNSIEHYDARLDELKLKLGVREGDGPRQTWLSDDKPRSHVAIVDKSIFDRSLLPTMTAEPVPFESITWMRHLDPVAGEYTALDKTVSLQAVVNAVGAVAARASAWLEVRPIPEYEQGDLGDLSDIGL